MGYSYLDYCFHNKPNFKKPKNTTKKKIDGCPSTDTLPPVSSLISAFSNNPALFPPFQKFLSLSLAWKGSLRKIMWFFCFDGCFSAIKDMVGSSRVGLGWIADSFTIWVNLQKGCCWSVGPVSPWQQHADGWVTQQLFSWEIAVEMLSDASLHILE